MTALVHSSFPRLADNVVDDDDSMQSSAARPPACRCQKGPSHKERQMNNEDLKLSTSLSTLSTTSGRFRSTESELSRSSRSDDDDDDEGFHAHATSSSSSSTRKEDVHHREGLCTRAETTFSIASEQEVPSDPWIDCLTVLSPPPFGEQGNNTSSVCDPSVRRFSQPNAKSSSPSARTLPKAPQPVPSESPILADPDEGALLRASSLSTSSSSTTSSTRGRMFLEEDCLANLLCNQAARGLFHHHSNSQAIRTAAGNAPAAAQRQSCIKVEYSHYENAAVFVSIAARMIGCGRVRAGYPRSFFVRQPEDPDLERSCLIDRLALGMRCKYPCYVLAWTYLQKLSWLFENEISLTTDTFQRLVVAAVVVATKFYDDFFYSNEHYARELGFPLETLNKLEMCFLVLLDFNLRVPRSDFEVAMSRFDDLRVSSCQNIGVTAWSGLNTAGIPITLVAIAALYNFLGPEKAGRALQLDSDLSGVIQAYLKSREKFGKRFESEEENLHRIGAMAKVRDIKKLVDQYAESKSACFRERGVCNR